VTARPYYPADASTFEQILGDVTRTLDLKVRLPAWPFRAARGNVDICQFSPAVEGPFGAVLQALVDVHGDTTVSLVALEPTPAYYRDNYGSYPAFIVPGENVAHSYWNAVSRPPGEDPTGSLAYTANVVGIAGGTGAWAVWAERSWDLALVVSQVAKGPWRYVS
jgi:hypothetical protein